MKQNKLFITLLVSFCALSAFAQHNLSNYSNEQLGSMYYAYPTPCGLSTPPPDGYVPFYISHYGRHGSRWITSDDRYIKVLDVFESAELTPLGADVYERLKVVWEDAQGRGGDLTPLGERQHKAIAQRMFSNYPEVFSGKAYISARASTSMRCVMSMAAFSESLKEQNPALHIQREANKRYMDYIAYTSPELEHFATKGEWKREFKAFEDKYIDAIRLITSLFVHPEQIEAPRDLMMGLYWIASDMQNTELNLSFYDIFEKEELYAIWRSINYRMYVCNAPSSLNQGITARSAASLLQNIIESAEAAIKEGTPQATLRFGHDTNLIRLLTLMQIEGCDIAESNFENIHVVWQDFSISPMGANLQLVFFKNNHGTILMKILLNEKEAKLPLKSTSAPYYNWEEVKAFYSHLW